MKEREISGILSYAVKKVRIKNALKFIKEGDFVLDIGCGFGEIIKEMPKNVIYEGIEKNGFLYNYCKEKYPERKFYFGDCREILKDIKNLYNVILLLSILEHLENPENLFEETFEKLKDKGKLIVYTPSKFAKFFLKIGSTLGFLSKMAKEEHKNLYNKRQVKNFGKIVGYEIIFEKDLFLGLSFLIVFEKNIKNN